ncbi:hypothetical protein [Methylobacterium sp. WL120]|uniref:hypothetical protein n=1 Tax=Methylobacterium sp. WL120 TaxID=2603887 RepID=UPI0011C9F193|nr:hypothetical protein [Methylobacterium sp. WL120]TXM69635.1 hypothetical protein FV229_04640 [Methylobacterium sp. WL120]
MTAKTYDIVDGIEAQSATFTLLDQMERSAKGNPEALMVLGNSMLAAAKLLFARSGIDEKQRAELYQEFWRPIVQEGADA